MATDMHQAAFPGEDISDRPGPGDRRPGPAGAGRRRPAQRPLPRRGPASPTERPGDATFTLRAGAEATAPPEWQGLARDEVRLMTVRPGGVDLHAVPRPARSCSSPATSSSSTPSATLPARLEARRADGVVVPLHVSTDAGRRQLGGGAAPARTTPGPTSASSPGTVLALPGGVRLTLLDGYPDPARPSRLWRARDRARGLRGGVPAGGTAQPIRYGYLRGGFPLAAYQNVYADRAGQRRDGQRRPAVHRAVLVAADGPRRRGRPADPAHRRLQPRAARAARPGARSPSPRRPPGW